MNSRQPDLKSISGISHLIPRESMGREQGEIEALFVIQDGMACRFKEAANGHRHIVGLLLPGDVCDLAAILSGRMDHSICALTSVTAGLIQPQDVVNLIRSFPRLSRALHWIMLVEDSIAREWIVNVGSRTALQRTAHLLCEIFWRLEAVGLTQGNQCRFSLTQMELGESLALSAVHINRTLMDMRRANLIRLQGGELELVKRQELQTLSGFDPCYLYLDGNTAMREPAGG